MTSVMTDYIHVSDGGEVSFIPGEMTDNRTTELLPCPFCGGEAKIIGSDDWLQPICRNHACPCDWTDWYTTEAEAIAAWNTRAELGSGTCDAIFDKDYYVGINGVCESLKCSSCGNPLSAKFRHCPWCGARIRKVVGEC